MLSPCQTNLRLASSRHSNHYSSSATTLKRRITQYEIPDGKDGHLTYNLVEAAADAMMEVFLLMREPAKDVAMDIASSPHTTEVMVTALEVCVAYFCVSRVSRVCECQLY